MFLYWIPTVVFSTSAREIEREGEIEIAAASLTSKWPGNERNGWINMNKRILQKSPVKINVRKLDSIRPRAIPGLKTAIPSSFRCWIGLNRTQNNVHSIVLRSTVCSFLGRHEDYYMDWHHTGLDYGAGADRHSRRSKYHYLDIINCFQIMILLQH